MGFREEYARQSRNALAWLKCTMEAKRVQGKPEVMAGIGFANEPQDVAQVDAHDAEVQEMQDETPRKRSRTARDVKVEGIFGTKARLEGMIGKIEIR